MNSSKILKYLSLYCTLTIFAYSLPSLGVTNAAANAEKKGPRSAPRTFSHLEKPWFQGSIEQAFRYAEKEQKRILLYSGASWCPPCNNLASQVFLHPEFQNIMKPFIVVYLDTDAEAAQPWLDKYKIHEVPMVILANQKGDEIFRFDGGRNFEDFKNTINAALNNKPNLSDLIGQVGKRKLSSEEWLLLQESDLNKEILNWDQQKLADTLTTIWLNCPEEMAATKASFAARIWAGAIGDKSLLKSTFSDHQSQMVEQILRPEAKLSFLESFLKGDIQKMIQLLPNDQQQKFKLQLLKILATAETDSQITLKERVRALFIQIDILYDAEHRLTENESQDLKSRFDRLALSAKSKYEKASVYPNIAMMIKKTLGIPSAVSFLESKVNEIDTPESLESLIAFLQQEAGNKDKALEWAEKAKESSKKSSAKLRYFLADAEAKSKLLKSDDSAIAASVEEYLDEVSKIQNGSIGWYRHAHKRIAEVIHKLGTRRDELLKKALASCSGNKECQDFYAATPAI